jgi:hypothetical protein
MHTRWARHRCRRACCTPRLDWADHTGQPGLLALHVVVRPTRACQSHRAARRAHVTCGNSESTRAHTDTAQKYKWYSACVFVRCDGETRQHAIISKSAQWSNVIMYAKWRGIYLSEPTIPPTHLRDTTGRLKCYFVQSLVERYRHCSSTQKRQQLGTTCHSVLLHTTRWNVAPTIR